MLINVNYTGWNAKKYKCKCAFYTVTSIPHGFWIPHDANTLAQPFKHMMCQDLCLTYPLSLGPVSLCFCKLDHSDDDVHLSLFK